MSSVVLTKLTDLAGAAGVPPSVALPLLAAAAVVALTWALFGRVARGGWYDLAALNKIPGKQPLPILGNALDFTVPTHEITDVRVFSLSFVKFNMFTV